MPAEEIEEQIDVEEQPVSRVGSGWMAQNKPAGGLPPLNVENAYKILDFHTQNPEWMVNPRTAQAANAIFDSASKVIGRNLELQRLNRGAKAALGQQRMAEHVVDNVNKAAQYDPSSLAWVYEKDDDGEMKLNNPKYWGRIQQETGQIISKHKAVEGGDTAATKDRADKLAKLKKAAELDDLAEEAKLAGDKTAEKKYRRESELLKQVSYPQGESQEFRREFAGEQARVKSEESQKRQSQSLINFYSKARDNAHAKLSGLLKTKKDKKGNYPPDVQGLIDEWTGQVEFYQGKVDELGGETKEKDPLGLFSK